jgi:predicted DNA-binding protein (MmcQ/YjbR family)
MNIESYRNYSIQKKEVTEGFPFPSLPNILVYKVAGKMFTATDINTFASISICCNTNAIGDLREKYAAVQKHPYFSEKHWALVMMDNSISDKLLLKWIDESYDLAVQKLTKKLRAKLNL